MPFSMQITHHLNDLLLNRNTNFIMNEVRKDEVSDAV